MWCMPRQKYTGDWFVMRDTRNDRKSKGTKKVAIVHVKKKDQKKRPFFFQHFLHIFMESLETPAFEQNDIKQSDRPGDLHN